MRLLMENEMRHGVDRQQPPQQDRDTSYSNFLVTQPPLFSETVDSLEANNWLRMTESKFGLLHCTEFKKTLYAAQQLRGSARAWRASYTATLPADHKVPWGEFHTAFRGHHLLVGLLRRMSKEFLDLEQGNHSLYDYTHQVNTLVQYGSYHVDTDEKNGNLICNGLMVQLQDHLNMLPNLSFNELASAAIDKEGFMKACVQTE
jgi:hypothetical protein